MNLQVYLYYQHYPNDARILKISVRFDIFARCVLEAYGEKLEC